MTIVALLTPNNVPCLLGDLLLSGDQQPSKAVSLPAMGDVTDFFGNSGWGVVGMRQKLVLISEKCALGWAGSLLGALTAIQDLRELARNEPLTAEKVYHFLEAHPDARHHDTSFIGLVIHADSSVQRFGVRAFQGSLGRLGADCLLMGSGVPLFLEVAAWPREDRDPEGDATQLDIAYVRVQQHIAQLLSLEVKAGYSAPTISALFGGGYEMVFPRRGRLEKMQAQTTVIWSAAPVFPGKVAITPHFMAKTEYYGDFLAIKSTTLNGKTWNTRVDLVSPMYQSAQRPTAEKIAAMDFNSPYVSQIVILELGTERRALAEVARQVPGQQRMLVVEESEGKIHLAPSTALTDALLTEIERHRGTQPSNT